MLNDINDVYNFCGFIANKQSSFEITPDEFNICINVAQQQYFKTKLGFPEEYSVEKREARQEFQTTQSNSDSLRPFIVTKSLIKNGAGFDIPTDFACFAGNSYLFVEQIDGVTTPSIQPIEVVTIGERGIRLNNYIKYPTYEYPIGTYLNGQLVTNPDDISAVTLTYVRYPKTPIRNYTVVNDFNVYDPIGSVQLEFPNLDWENIAHLVVRYWSVFMRDNDLYAVEETRIKTGN
jgi:hypothetical protein